MKRITLQQWDAATLDQRDAWLRAGALLDEDAHRVLSERRAAERLRPNLAALCDTVLTGGLPASLRQSIEDTIAKGGSVAGCVRSARCGGASKLLCAAVEACAEAALKQRKEK